MPVRRSTKMIEFVIVVYLLIVLAKFFFLLLLERFTCKK